jgi:hypothetical protein
MMKEVETINGLRCVKIPQVILEQGKSFRVYGYHIEQDGSTGE